MVKRKALSFTTIQNELCEVMDGHVSKILKTDGILFPHDIRVMRPAGGRVVYYEIAKDAVATHLHPDDVAGRLSNFLESLPKQSKEANIDFEKCMRVVKAWSRKTEKKVLKEIPHAIAFASDLERICFHRLDFDPEEPSNIETDAPIFSNFLSRMSNKEAFCARLGSLFVDDIDRKKVCWIWGPTDGGKSALANMIRELVSSAACASPGDEDLEGNHWKAAFVGKRVALVMEAGTRFIKRSAFKGITGDDYHQINPKGMPQYDGKIETVFFFFSNDAPAVPSDPALQNRLIACELASLPEGERLPKSDFQARIREERKYIVAYCRSIYEQKGIHPDMQDVHKLSERLEGEYIEWLSLRFVRDQTSYILGTEFNHAAYEAGMRSKIEHGKLRKVLERLWSVTTDFVDFGNGSERVRRRVLRGLRWRRGYAEKYRNFGGLKVAEVDDDLADLQWFGTDADGGETDSGTERFLNDLNVEQ